MSSFRGLLTKLLVSFIPMPLPSSFARVFQGWEGLSG